MLSVLVFCCGVIIRCHGLTYLVCFYLAVIDFRDDKQIFGISFDFRNTFWLVSFGCSLVCGCICFDLEQIWCRSRQTNCSLSHFTCHATSGDLPKPPGSRSWLAQRAIRPCYYYCCYYYWCCRNSWCGSIWNRTVILNEKQNKKSKFVFVAKLHCRDNCKSLPARYQTAMKSKDDTTKLEP